MPGMRGERDRWKGIAYYIQNKATYLNQLEPLLVHPLQAYRTRDPIPLYLIVRPFSALLLTSTHPAYSKSQDGKIQLRIGCTGKRKERDILSCRLLLCLVHLAWKEAVLSLTSALDSYTGTLPLPVNHSGQDPLPARQLGSRVCGDTIWTYALSFLLSMRRLAFPKKHLGLR